MIRRPPRSTQGVSSAASDVYKRQVLPALPWPGPATSTGRLRRLAAAAPPPRLLLLLLLLDQANARQARQAQARPSQGKAQQASQPSQGRGCFFQTPLLPLHYSSQGRFFPPKITIWGIYGATNCRKKLRSRGGTYRSGEIRAGILHITARRMCKMVGWRPSW